MRALAGLLIVALVSIEPAAALGQTVEARPQLFDIRVDEKIGQNVSGRLMIFAQPWSLLESRFSSGRVPNPVPRFVQIIADPASPYSVAFAANEIEQIRPGHTVVFNADDLAYPMPFSRLSEGRFAVQVLLDVDHSNNFTPGDLMSDIFQVHLPSERISFTLNTVLRRSDPWDLREPASGQPRQNYEIALVTKSRTERINFPSEAMRSFSGKQINIRAYVLTPPGYDYGRDRYPTVYVFQGFGTRYESIFSSVQRTYKMMEDGQIPHMIWVFLDQQIATGAHGFADSANNGPWGRALTEEFIPWLESRYRTDGKASGRFTTGHSSGGWAALWLQVRYPKLFGGTWPTAPDPVDFRNFINVNIYASNANAYRYADGVPIPLVRQRDGAISATLQQYAQVEQVLGDVGGQLGSFDWVFSPRGDNGKPQPLFNRGSGEVDPEVAKYWRDNYDISHRIKENWNSIKYDIDGKIHITVGTMDTYYLDRSVVLLKESLDQLGVRSYFHFREGRGHSDLGFDAGDPYALDKIIAWEIYETARPGIMRPPLIRSRSLSPLNDSRIPN